ncbi:hypothetical protein SDJN03_05370, partial [Cucurbita argyrosperma subsp. sororia]
MANNLIFTALAASFALLFTLVAADNSMPGMDMPPNPSPPTSPGSYASFTSPSSVLGLLLILLTMFIVKDRI